MYFRKLLSGCIAVLILVAQMGVALHVRYCAGEVAAVETVVGFSEITKDVAKSCCGATIESTKKMRCCTDKQLTFKDTSAKVLVKNVTPDLLALVFELPSFYLNYQNEIAIPTSQKLDYYCDIHGPPLYQRYSQFVFYA
ncbi:hypothetical protein [Flavobacterium sp.]|uniref:HYC_CC_PP family protein n=1 Tax=Flavobacterium sp. TaxID=239 RepID=UPI002627922B|nr:hypothetical protein [Flavobacterium sp.]